MPAARDEGLTSVIVVAADSGPLLRQSVSAALGSTAAVEVIVIDNASADGEPARLVAEHAGEPRLHVSRNASNIGFGPACNRGAASARGDALLFLNPDCLIETGTIAALRTIAAGDAAIGLIGIDIRSPSGESARGNRRRDPTLRRALMSLTGLSRLQRRRPSFEGVEMPARDPSSDIERVDAVSGACMFVPRSVFDAVGGFDEQYFLHVEDLDLCRRVRDAGYAVAFASALRAVHLQGSSSRHRPLFVAWHKHRGMWRYFRRFDPAARHALLRALVWLGTWLHFAACLPIYVWKARRA